MTRNWLRFSATVALMSGLVSGVAAQDVFINDATIVTNTNTGVIESGDVLIRDGRIERLGGDFDAPDGATEINGAGHWVTPGLFAPLSELGLVEISLESSTNDARAAKAKTSVSDRVADSFNPKSPIIDNNRIEGITHAGITARASNSIFAGTGLVADMSGEFDSVENDAAFVYVQYGSGGAELAGGTRAAAMSQLRAGLEDAREFTGRFGGPDDGDALSRRDARAFVDILRGRMPLVVGADRASDLLNLISLSQEYGRIDLIIYGAAEGWMVADELAAANVKVMVDPLENLPASFDRVASRLDNATLLVNAGVEIAIMTRSADFSHNVRVLAQHAGNAVAEGLSWEAAFAAISVNPAQWFGIDIGTLERGDSANLVVWDGDPLEVTSSPQMIMIKGETQSLSSRQTELRDRYNPTTQTGEHFKYR